MCLLRFCLTAQDILQAWNPVCLGIIHGVMGKIKVLPGELFSFPTAIKIYQAVTWLCGFNLYMHPTLKNTSLTLLQYNFVVINITLPIPSQKFNLMTFFGVISRFGLEVSDSSSS